jgi:hypothetical protein
MFCFHFKLETAGLLLLWVTIMLVKDDGLNHYSFFLNWQTGSCFSASTVHCQIVWKQFLHWLDYTTGPV